MQTANAAFSEHIMPPQTWLHLLLLCKSLCILFKFCLQMLTEWLKLKVQHEIWFSFPLIVCCFCSVPPPPLFCQFPWIQGWRSRPGSVCTGEKTLVQNDKDMDSLVSAVKPLEELLIFDAKAQPSTHAHLGSIHTRRVLGPLVWTKGLYSICSVP